MIVLAGGVNHQKAGYTGASIEMSRLENEWLTAMGRAW
jgi:hypothetical protein